MYILLVNNDLVFIFIFDLSDIPPRPDQVLSGCSFPRADVPSAESGRIATHSQTVSAGYSLDYP